MKEPYKQGVANQLGLESCAGTREGASEALTEGSPGQPLSSESNFVGCVPTQFCHGEGHTKRSVQREFLFDAPESETLRMGGNSHHGNRETSPASAVPTRGPAANREPAADGAAKAPCRKAATHASEESDGPIVPQKRTNKAGSAMPVPAAESVEGRGPAKGNAPQTALDQTQSWQPRSRGLLGVRCAAARDKKTRFTALLHHVTVDLLRASYLDLKRQAAPGVDGVTWHEYGQDLEARLADLHQRVHRGSYRAQPSKRTWIPKEDGRMRPLGIAALEDKIVQQAVKTVLEGIYEQDFHGFSYGFRPGRGCHNALDAVSVAVLKRKVNWVLDADIQGFFDAIDHDRLLKFLEIRIGDRRILRLLKKWLRAGVSEEGEWSPSNVGTPQGAVISPLLANVFLHYVLDAWVTWWRAKQARGEVVIVRYADDFVMGFQYRDDANRCLQELRERFEAHGLKLHPEKTRLIEFGRFAAQNRAARGEGPPETFAFLGFVHYCGQTRKTKEFAVHRRTLAKRLRRKLREVKDQLRRRMHHPLCEVGSWLRQVVRGWLNYYAVPGNFPSLQAFVDLVTRTWYRTICRRSQRKGGWTWDRMRQLARRWLPRPKILHPYPTARLRVTPPKAGAV